MTGVSTWAALLPVLQAEWHTSNTIAGVVSGAFFAGYLAAVPVLVSLTDRVPARRVYICSCGALACGAIGFALGTGPATAMVFQAVLGAGLAGTYMPGLKELSDRIVGPRQGRAIAFYTSTFGIGTSLSLFVSGLLQRHFGWRAAFLAGAVGPLLAAALMRRLPPAPRVSPASRSSLSFRSVLRDRRVLGYVIGYTAHCWELFALRSWLVAFLGYAATGVSIAPSTIAAAVNLLGPPASIAGNEIAAGRRVRMVRYTMFAGAALAFGMGLTARRGSLIVIAVTAAYVITIMGDSAALTAGLVETSDPAARGTVMAVYSFFGFGGGLLGPIVFGTLLDAGGGTASHRAWILAFASLTAVSLLGAASLTARSAALGAKQKITVD